MKQTKDLALVTASRNISLGEVVETEVMHPPSDEEEESEAYDDDVSLQVDHGKDLE